MIVVRFKAENRVFFFLSQKCAAIYLKPDENKWLNNFEGQFNKFLD